MTKVKICGITRLCDARTALAYGADVLGFIFTPRSARRITVQNAAEIIKAVGPFCMSVGVFMDQTEKDIRRTADRLRLSGVQLHGQEEVRLCRRLRKDYRVVKTIFPGQQDIDIMVNMYREAVDAFLLDVHPEQKAQGAASFDWKSIYRRHRRFFSSGTKIILSGGLTPKTVRQAIDIFSPYAVDVASGVEYTKGLKDERLLRSFIRQAKSSE